MKIHLSPAVRAAIEDHRPVVALESTIIAHGMPYPKNVETAQRVESVVREAGAVPATCAIIGGVMKAGISADEMDMLGKEGKNIAKASRRDMAYLMSKGLNGATTVAGTMIIAHRAGIRIFATGGIGGVHRGATSTLDISADLPELAQTPVAVVSAGVKSILDIGLTLEYLETWGVPVIGYGTKEFPAFFTRKSGFDVDYTLHTPQEIAAFLAMQWQTGLKGALIANPVPLSSEGDPAIIDAAIAQALQEAHAEQIHGKAVTPYLLARVERITGGRSLETNIGLVCHNAELAAKIAVSISEAS